MRKTLLLLASVVLSVVVASFVLLCSGFPGTVRREAQAVTTKPNFVFVLTDDMRKGDLKYMPKTRHLLGDRGMTFKDALVSDALCSPSRASIMRGQYAHNTGVWSNYSTDSTYAVGGWRAYRRGGNEADNVATRLHAAGYRTALFGKYLNGYESGAVPRGWDRWFATVSPGDPPYFGYDVSDQGTVRHYGTKSRDYITDVLRRRATRFVAGSAAQGRPFFAYVATTAPHGPFTPAPRDAGTFDGLKAPRPPSFDEKDVSDKPPWIAKLPRLTPHEVSSIDGRYEKRAECLQAVDDLVAGVVKTLRNKGVMDNTYVFFTSDNGGEQGEHRLAGSKWRPYEEDVRMPLLVRGPGVAPGSTTHKLALNTDYLPTFADLAGEPRPPYADGRSLKPVLRGNATAWRSAVLLEAAPNRFFAPYSPAYRGVRTMGRKYVEYARGERELYDLKTDPYELHNNYTASAPPGGLAKRLDALKGCAGSGCHAAEDAGR